MYSSHITSDIITCVGLSVESASEEEVLLGLRLVEHEDDRPVSRRRRLTADSDGHHDQAAVGG